MHMATKTAAWTADELERLPDDGNRYEVVDGELFVTPAPALVHQAVQMAFVSRLITYDPDKRIGWLFCAPADVHFDQHNQTQPDILIIPRTAGPRPRTWRSAPRPLLVVEILSPTTAWRDFGAKRDLYRRKRIPTYWIVDHEERLVHVVRTGMPDVVARETLTWEPEGAAGALVIDLPALFREALDD